MFYIGEIGRTLGLSDHSRENLSDVNKKKRQRSNRPFIAARATMR